MPAISAKAPSTSAYAPKRKTNTVNVICGQTKANMPKRMAAMPRSTSAHQLLANTSNILFPSFLTYLVGAALRGPPVSTAYVVLAASGRPGSDGGAPTEGRPYKVV